MPRDTRRAERVAEAIREEVASYLATGIRDPRVTGFVTVTGVDLTPDLRHARVYVSLLSGDGSSNTSTSVDATLEALNDIGWRLKGEIGRALRLRLVPELEFRLDDTIVRASRIESLLAQIKTDDDKRDN
jgi:ribosome-binding factor A